MRKAKLRRRSMKSEVLAAMMVVGALSGACVDGEEARFTETDGWDVLEADGVESEGRDEGDPASLPPSLLPDEQPEPPLSSCEGPYSPQWVRARDTPWEHDPVEALWGPGDGMYVELTAPVHSVHGGTRIYRPADGETFHTQARGMLGASSANDERLLGASADLGRTLWVSDTEGGELLRVHSMTRGVDLLSVSLSPTEWARHAQLSEDGALLAAVIYDFDGSSGSSEVSARWWSVDDGQMLGDVVLCGREDSCYAETSYFYGSLEFTPDGRHALVAVRDSTELLQFDLQSGKLVTRHDLQPGQSSAAAGILDIAVAPDGVRVATTSRDGFLRLYSLDERRPIAEAIPVGVFDINRNTYLPTRISSPLAWSPDGRLLAFGDPEGRVRLLEDGELRSESVATSTALDDESPEAYSGLPDPPHLLAFSHDGRSLGVSFDRRIGVYRCGEAPAPATDTLDVELSIPSRMPVGEDFDGVFTVHSDAPLIGFRILLDGEEFRRHGVEDGAFSVSFFHAPGTHDLTIEAFDGRASGSATVELTVVAE